MVGEDSGDELGAVGDPGSDGFGDATVQAATTTASAMAGPANRSIMG